MSAFAQRAMPCWSPPMDTSTCSLPRRTTLSAGMVVIRALTFEGPQVVFAVEDELGQGRHAASPVFHAAHEVIAQTRRASP